MAKARIELHKDGDHMAIVTNAADEHDFWESFCELVGNLITDDVLTGYGEDGEAGDGMHYGGDWEFQLRYWLPQATEIVCKLRGYKTTDVHEERVLVSGYGNPHHKAHEIGPSDLVLAPPPLEESTAA